MAATKTTSKPEIFEKVREIIAITLGVDETDITSSSHFVHDHGGDSIDCMEIVMALEEEFNIKIADKHAENMVTAKYVFEYIEKRMSGEKRAA